MSGCACESSTDYRVTGEVYETAPDGAVGGGEKTARIRCANCGGKVSYVGSDLLVALGLDLDDVRNGRCLSDDRQITLEVDLY